MISDKLVGTQKHQKKFKILEAFRSSWQKMKKNTKILQESNIKSAGMNMSIWSRYKIQAFEIIWNLKQFYEQDECVQDSQTQIGR